MALILSCGGDFGTNEDCLWIEYQRKKKKRESQSFGLIFKPFSWKT